VNPAWQNGQKVHYLPFTGSTEPENGIVKSQCEDGRHVFVVYKCDGDWENYQNYTAARTLNSDLREGWV
jgi:hypothetical protein